MINGDNFLNDMDNDLSILSDRLFKIDMKSRKILGQIAKKGPMTIYELKKSSHNDLSRTSIYRRLQGDRNIVGLLTEKYLRLEGKSKFERIEHREKKYYGLTLKGFLASLSAVTCEKNYMFKIFLQTYEYYRPLWKAFEELSQEKKGELWKDFLNRIKNDLIIFFQYHAENGMDLTYIKQPNIYFGMFWSSIVPFQVKQDPFSFHDKPSPFSAEWKQLWDRREGFIESTKIKSYSWDLKRSEKRSKRKNNKIKEKKLDYLPLDPNKDYQKVFIGYIYLGGYNDPWVYRFNNCWATREEFESEVPHPDWGFIEALLKSYETVLKELRPSKIPWKIEDLIRPRPEQDLIKELRDRPRTILRPVRASDIEL